jgi:hypothetical protein
MARVLASMICGEVSMERMSMFAGDEYRCGLGEARSPCQLAGSILRPMDAGGKPTRILDYATPPPVQPGLLTAFLLCFPGLVCWYDLICCYLLNLLDHFGWGFLAPSSFSLMMLFLVAAVITGIASIIYYWNKPKPWYVVLCLTSNIVGLLVSGWLIGTFTYAVYTYKGNW